MGIILSSEELYKIHMLGNCWIVVFNATFNNISIISWRSVLLVGEIGVPGWENNRLVIRHSYTLSLNVVSSTSRLSGNQTNVSHWSDMLTLRLLFQWASTKRISSSFHWKLKCSRHDIAENWWIGVKQQSLTHSPHSHLSGTQT